MAEILFYYITDRKRLGASEPERQRRLLAKIAEAASAGLDFIQLREKDLAARELEALACDAMAVLADFPQTRLLVNSRIDVALAAGAHGVHLRSDDLDAAAARGIWTRALPQTKPLIAVSCHSPQEVAMAEAQGADFAVFGPVFGKLGTATIAAERPGKTKSADKEARRKPADGIALLRAACSRPAAAATSMPVLALGGVTAANALECLEAGAAGVAGIRLFQKAEVAAVVSRLRAAMGPSHGKSSKGKHPYWS